ncbi:MAG TPA: hypothetical protein VGP61_11895, partial [Gemmatimonadales bacterium]|nr:hypothetical protein [Gemmatimonadales bacterium]
MTPDLPSTPTTAPRGGPISKGTRGRWRALAAPLAVLAAAVLSMSQSRPIVPPPPPVDVLVVHDSRPGPLPSGIVCGTNILDLLGHFGLKGNIVSIDNYRPGDIARYR